MKNAFAQILFGLSMQYCAMYFKSTYKVVISLLRIPSIFYVILHQHKYLKFLICVGI